MTGLALAPLLQGSVNPELQTVISALFGLNLLLLAFNVGEADRPVVPAWVCWSLVFILLIPLVPLPAACVKALSPARYDLELAFPIEAPRGWVSLAVSPADSIQRCWEIGMMIAAAVLARHAGHHGSLTRGVALAVTLALVVLAASDVYYRATGQERLLGIWETTWGKGAGTFANRNHFANWLVVGGIFVFGWWLRCAQPLHGARPAGRSGVHRHPRIAWVLAAILGFALVMAVLSASRGASIGLIAGGGVWLALVVHRSRNKRRRWMLGLLALAGIAVLVWAGDLLLDRLSQARLDLTSRYPRMDIWRQTFVLAMQFPVTGVGVGGFLKAYGYFKKDLGGTTVWHAENDWVQTLLELGVPGTLLVIAGLGFVFRAAWRHAWVGRCQEPELIFGALAGLIAFGVHACVEFVVQIPGTALLAAACFGLVLGGCDQAERPAVPLPPARSRVVLNLILGLALLAAALTQGMAWKHWSQASRTQAPMEPAARLARVQESLAWWPFASNRYLALTRLGAEVVRKETPDTRLASADALRHQLNSGIRLDPMNWELRLERAWLDLSFFRATPRPRTTLTQAVRINPLQPSIPLQFAEALLKRDPEWALDLLEAVDRSKPANLQRVLALAIRLPEGSAACLNLTPDFAGSLAVLADFALNNGARPLALAALNKLEGRMESLALARLYLRADAPDQVLALLPEPILHPPERLVAGHAHFLASRYAEAIRLAESVWQSSRFRNEIELAPPVKGSIEALRAALEDAPKDPKVAADFAEKLAEASRPDAAALRGLVERFPGNLRIRWLHFHGERLLQRQREAAAAALALATLTLGR
jgi:O-antigen ligase